jgi:hypothetical protein
MWQRRSVHFIEEKKQRVRQEGLREKMSPTICPW